jgi:putative Mg2+ transporter-C (MgtC) family protein
VLHSGLIVLDPSRVAAQIVSGIGFIGAGLIFVRRDSVRGLTTAASVWITAAIGAAAGAGLILLAAEGTVAYLVIIVGLFPLLTRHLPRSSRAATTIRLRYPDGRGVLRRVLHAATDKGFIIDELSAEPIARRTFLGSVAPDDEPLVEVRLRVRGRPPVSELAAALSELDDVAAVVIDDDQDGD